MNINEILYQKINKTSHIEDKDLFFYGVEVIKSYSLFLFLSFILGFIFKTHKQMFCFIFFFTVLHRYTGGFHFQNTKLCLLMSIFLSLGLSFMIKYIIFTQAILITIIFTLAILVTFICKTTDTKEKRITEHERTYFTKMAIILEIVYYFIAIVAQYYNKTELVACLCICVLFCTLQVILSKLVNQ